MLGCMVLVRFYDPKSGWDCYVYAQNPQEPDEIMAITVGWRVETGVYHLSSILGMYDQHGNPPQKDPDFRPVSVACLLKQLRSKYNDNQGSA